MTKLLVTVLLLFFSYNNLKSQNCINVVNKNYIGVVLRSDSSFANFLCLTLDCDSFSAFDPNLNLISKFEEGLKEKIEKMNVNRECQNPIKNCPIIHRSLKRYYRKYLGATNKITGVQYMIVSFKLKKHTSKEELCKNMRFISFDDGCSETFLVVYSIPYNKVAKLMLDCE